MSVENTRYAHHIDYCHIYRPGSSETIKLVHTLAFEPEMENIGIEPDREYRVEEFTDSNDNKTIGIKTSFDSGVFRLDSGKHETSKIKPGDYVQFSLTESSEKIDIGVPIISLDSGIIKSKRIITGVPYQVISFTPIHQSTNGDVTIEYKIGTKIDRITLPLEDVKKIRQAGGSIQFAEYTRIEKVARFVKSAREMTERGIRRSTQAITSFIHAGILATLISIPGCIAPESYMDQRSIIVKAEILPEDQDQLTALEKIYIASVYDNKTKDLPDILKQRNAILDKYALDGIKATWRHSTSARGEVSFEISYTKNNNYE